MAPGSAEAAKAELGIHKARGLSRTTLCVGLCRSATSLKSDASHQSGRTNNIDAAFASNGNTSSIAALQDSLEQASAYFWHEVGEIQRERERENCALHEDFIPLKSPSPKFNKTLRG